jgi:Ribosome biogenesis protein SLX9
MPKVVKKKRPLGGGGFSKAPTAAASSEDLLPQTQSLSSKAVASVPAAAQSNVAEAAKASPWAGLFSSKWTKQDDSIVNQTSSDSTTQPPEPLATTTTKQAVQSTPAPDPTKPAAKHLSRGQRKRQQKREQYLRREQLVLSCLKLKPKSSHFDGMNEMKQALLSSLKTASTSTPPPRNLLRSQKSRQVLMAKEIAQLGLVLQHPAFQANPWDTLQQHLTNSTAAVPTEKRPAVRRDRPKKTTVAAKPKHVASKHKRR